MFKTDNVKVKNLTKRSVCGTNTIIGANLNFIARELNCVNHMVLGMSKSNMFLVKYEGSIPVGHQNSGTETFT